jgi:hypothetical protein
MLFDRNPEFIRWRFLECPYFKYDVYAYIKENRILGLIVLRNAKRKKIPLTVIVDFLVDNTYKESKEAAATLLHKANQYALSTFSPFIVTLDNSECYEAKLLKSNGFRILPKKVLPHESNFIFKLHGKHQSHFFDNLCNFSKWHFTFADYDIF